jgi:hypothetical protein
MFIELFYPNPFPSTFRYLRNDFNNGKSTVTFTSFMLTKFNLAIVFVGDAFNLFNIRQDYSYLIALLNHQAVTIVFDNNDDYLFEL